LTVELFTQADIENALGKPLFVAIYDDDNDGNPDSAPIAACIDSATSDVLSWLAGNYTDWSEQLPDPIPSAMKYAAVDFAMAYTARRRPDIFKATNSTTWQEFEKSAIEKMKRYAQAAQRLPAATAAPKNVGSYTTSTGTNIFTDDPDGTSNQGDF